MTLVVIRKNTKYINLPKFEVNGQITQLTKKKIISGRHAMKLLQMKCIHFV